MTIGVVSPSKEFTRIVEEVSKELQIPVLIREGALKRGVIQAKRLIEEYDVSILVARGATADLLEKILETPVVKIKVNGFDLIKTIGEAKKLGSKIVFIDSKNNPSKYDLSLLEELFSIKIILRQYIDEIDINNHIKDVAKSNLNSVIVGTAECMAKNALRNGLQSFVIDSPREAISSALLQAEETYQLFEREKLRQNHLETIISYAFDGVIATDYEGKIFVYNQVAEMVIGFKYKEFIGRKLDKIQHPFLRKLYGNGETVEKDIITLGDQRYIVNRIRINESKESFVITFHEANKLVELDGQLRRKLNTKRFYAKHSFKEIFYVSAIMERTIGIAKQFSRSDSSIFIHGESGTGKELFAQSIHNESSREEGPFIAVNCAALPKEILESELFGYEEGAFTGAKKGGKPGLFEMAHQGTLFLDEIGELSLELQSRLLRVLQEKEVLRLGGERIIPVNVRIISASNKNLRQLVGENTFREDLYYRLNVLQINLPPLRDRKEDLPLLINHILNQNSNNEDKMLTPDILQELLDYNWPGNVRELQNVLERIVVLKDLTNDNLSDLVFDIDDGVDKKNKKKIEVSVGSMKDMEGEIIRNLYKIYKGNKQEIADILEISRTTIWKKIKEQEGALVN